MATPAYDLLRHFQLFLWNHWIEFNKLDRKQDLNILYQACVFWADQKNKIAFLSSDWLRHFRLFLWNRWTEFNETWQKASSQIPLPSLCFSSRKVNNNCHPGQSIKEGGTFQKLLQPRRLQQQTECIAVILKHVGWSVVVFGSIPKSNFWSVDCTQVSDSGLLGLLFLCPFRLFHFLLHWASPGFLRSSSLLCTCKITFRWFHIIQSDVDIRKNLILTSVRLSQKLEPWP